jgi:hypothetical protein
MAAKYAWGDGRGKVHSIPLAQHKTDVRALHALGGSTDLTAPPTGVQAYREAQAAATAQFGPQVAAAQQQVTNVAPWFQDYMARVAGYAQAANAQAQPVIQQAQGYQTGAAAQTAPGLDPNSDAGKQAAQAAQGRQALGQLGLDALNSQNTATQNYLGGLGTTAAKEQPQAQTAAANALATAKSQRGAAVTDFLTTARQNAQNYRIATGTLNLNTEQGGGRRDEHGEQHRRANNRADNKVITSGPFAGFTNKQVAQMGPQDKQHYRAAAKTPEKVLTSTARSPGTRKRRSVGHSPAWIQQKIDALRQRRDAGADRPVRRQARQRRRRSATPATRCRRPGRWSVTCRRRA